MNLSKHTGLVLILLITGIATLPSWQEAKPHVFLLGDSISIHYGPYLKKYADEFAFVELKQEETVQGKKFPRNGGDSRRVLDYLMHKLNEPGFSPDYLILNCGLHDINRDSATRSLQVPLNEYKQNLEKVMTLVAGKKIKLLWVNSTPVVDSIHNAEPRANLRFASDLDLYNLEAAELCRKYRVPVIDLHTFTRELGNTAYFDHVHFKDYAQDMQGKFLAEALRNHLN